MLIGTVGLSSGWVSAKGKVRAAGTGSLIAGRQSVSSALTSEGYELTDKIKLPTPAAMKVARKLADCAAESKPDLIRSYLAGVVRGSVTPQQMQKLNPTFERCILKDTEGSTELKMGGHIGFALHADAYGRKFGVPAVKPLPISELYDMKEFQAYPTGSWKTAFCLAVTHPEVISNVLRTVPNSPDETVAFGAVAPLVGPCTDSGAKIVFKRELLRLEMAAAYFTIAEWQKPHPTMDLN